MENHNLPHNLEAEQAVLSAILLNNRAIEYVSEFLRPEHFVHPAHQEIYKLAEKYFAKGIPVDVATTREYLAQTGVLESLGGTDYMDKLSHAGAGVGDIKSYGRIVYENFLRRELINLGQAIVQNASVEDLDKSAANHIEEAEQKLFELATGDESKDAKPASTAFAEALREIEIACKSEGLSGLTTGLRDLDKITHGLHKSDLIILAGRPAMGKTTVALNIAFNAAYAIRKKQANPDYKGQVLLFSLEMSRAQLAQKILSSQVMIPADAMREGRLSDPELTQLSNSANSMNDLPMIVDETPAMSVASIRAKARRIARKNGGLALIVIDYLQLMQGSNGGRRDGNRVQEISEITRGMKILAKELDVPVLLLSQLSRSVESQDRKSKKPILSDLRDSGSIEQDADIVMFTYREEYYLTHQDPEDNLSTKYNNNNDPRGEEWKKRMQVARNKAELVIGKNRHGPIKDVKLNCQLEYSLFSDCDDDMVIAPTPEDNIPAAPVPDAPPAEAIPDEF
ncbi:MAG: replicative DNA helicase [Rickettsiales bacterium]|jgi:replicative DNA helicase|nr:replicative DNA helicase [Rickettsiales bacterium]